MRPSLIAALIVVLAPLVGAATGLAEQDEEPARLDPGERGRVRIDGALWEALQPDDVVDPELPGPAALVREVRLEPGDDVLLVRATWRLDALEPGWFDAVLAGPELRDVRVTWDGGPAAWDSGAAGVQVTGFVEGPTVIELRGELPGDPFARTSFLRLYPAIRGEAEVVLPADAAATLEGDGVVRADPGAWWASGPGLQLTLREATPPRDRGTLAVGAVGIGLTVGDTELSGRARVRWTLRRGQLPRLSLRVSGVGDDLQVTGSTVRQVSRSGDRLQVELQAAAETAVELDLAWSQPLPTGNEGQLQLPVIVPEGVSRTSSSLQLARDGEWEALPELSGWAPRAGALLPDWGRDLVEGTPTASFVSGTAGRAGTISLLRFEPVSGPPVVVDVADHEIAATAEGRLLTRVRYEVINDRGAFLEILPPFGSDFLTVRVDEEPVVPIRASGAWRIPLPRSLETVSGLISVPVEVVLLAEGEPWSRRETRTLPLPHVDAPVATARVTLYLPPGYSELPRNDDHRRVDSFTEGEGISWGFLADDEDSRDKVAKADLVFKQAADAWLGNDFDEAQRQLDLLTEMGASNSKTGQLQSNLDVVFEPMHGEDFGGEGRGAGSAYGSGGGGGDSLDSAGVEFHDEADNKRGSKSQRSSGEVALRRRIRDQARARGEEEYREYESTRREAEQALQEGDLEAAEQRFRRAREVGRKLEYYEQEESEEVSQLNMEIDRQLAEVTVQRQEKEKRLVKAVGVPKPKKKVATKAPKPPALAGRRSVETTGVGGGRGGLGVSGTGTGGGGSVSRGATGASSSGSTSSVTHYDFDSDSISGELLKPEEKDVYTYDRRATGNIDAPAPPPRPEPTPAPVQADGVVSGPTVTIARNGLGYGDDVHLHGEVHEPDVSYVLTPTVELPPADVAFATGLLLDATTVPSGAHTILTVTAATRSVPIPRIGQPLRYQQLLLPAGEAPNLVVRARLPRSEGTPR